MAEIALIIIAILIIVLLIFFKFPDFVSLCEDLGESVTEAIKDAFCETEAIKDAFCEAVEKWKLMIRGLMK